MAAMLRQRSKATSFSDSMSSNPETTTQGDEKAAQIRRKFDAADSRDSRSGSGSFSSISVDSDSVSFSSVAASNASQRTVINGQELHSIVEIEGGNHSGPAQPEHETENGGGNKKKKLKWPEKKLIWLAIGLAILEKAASSLGVMSFIWATVVLLGGFANAVELVDFLFVTIILVVQGFRIFSGRHELRWYHHRNLNGTVIASKHKVNETENRTLYYLPRIIGRTLYYLQLLSAIACVVLSLLRIIKGYYSSSSKNLKTALIIFYSLVLSEAVMSLVQKAWLVFNFTILKLLHHLDCSYGFHDSSKSGECGNYMEHFFYYVYSKCINSHALDGLQVDLVCYSEELLLSNKPDQQLRGATILCKLTSPSDSNQEECRLHTLRKIGTSSAAIERLIEMLGWENTEEEIRISAAQIVQELAGKRQNVHRLTSIPGCMESISSLLSYKGTDKDIAQRLSVLAFGILVLISKGDENRGKIGNTRGLLTKIINFTAVEVQPHETVDLAIQVLQKLARTKGPTGSHLRGEMLKNVFIVSNLKSIIQKASIKIDIRNNAIDVLKYLAMEDIQGRDKIGRTGGVIGALVHIFLEENSEKASEALFFLSLDHSSNCERIVRTGDDGKDIVTILPKLLQSGQNENYIIYSANILHNIYLFGNLAQSVKEDIAKVTLPTAFDRIINSKKECIVQSFLGLAIVILPETKLNGVEIEVKCSLIYRILDRFKLYTHPSPLVPNVRRYMIELVGLMMDFDKQCQEMFEEHGLFEALNGVLKTTSDLEAFYMFSGSIGIKEHKITMDDLVKKVLSKISNDS